MRVSTLLLLAVLVVSGVLFLVTGDGSRDVSERTGACVDDPECLVRDTVVTLNREALVEAPEPTIEGEGVCPSAGYLCEGLRRRGDLRVVRWDLGTPEIRIRVPRPTHEDPAIGRQLQAAAVSGILAWQNHPFPLRVIQSDRPGEEDFTVSWSRQLSGGELGHARTQWSRRGNVSTMRVEAFALATRSPWDETRPLTARQIQLTAAHEMGHALGLPHSAAERDLMFPMNTASRLTPQDYYTMEALYRLENGAVIVLPGS